MRCYLHRPKVLQVTFCYCYHTWAAQLIRGVRVTRLDISFISWLRVIRIPFYVFWSLQSWWPKKTRGKEIPQRLISKHSYRPFWACPWDLLVPMIRCFAGKKQTFSLGTTLLKWHDQDFYIIRWRIKGILLD